MITTDATNLPRFMQCNGNILLQADPIPLDRDNTIREEGNAAHWLASVVSSGQNTINEMLDRKAPNGIYITAEMAEHVEEYLSSEFKPDKAVQSYYEWSYSITGQNWQVNGRGDRFIYSNGILNIDDFKYGYSIVEPENNWTLISHAIGFCITNNVEPDIITFTIYQPRAPHSDGRIRSKSITYPELISFYNEMNSTLSNPNDRLQTGPNCYKCKSFVGCPARQQAELRSIEVSHNAFNAEISNNDLSERMIEIDRAIDLLKQSKKSYEEQTLHRLKEGQIIPNFGTEDDYANRSWLDWITPEFIEAITGRNDICKKTLPTPRQTELQKILSEDVVKNFTERKYKGMKLKRVNTNKKAEKLFGEK